MDEKGIPENRYPEQYLLVYDQFPYPTKHIVSLANRYVNYAELDPIQFNSIEANKYLEALGFQVFRKPKTEEGQKWLAVASPENWSKCLNSNIWAADDNRSQQIKKMQKNDEIVVYLIGMKLAALCLVVSEYYYDETKIWDNGVYPHRVKIEPILIPINPVDIKKLYNIYLRYKGSSGGYFGQSIRPLPLNEYSIFQSEFARVTDKLVKWDNVDENRKEAQEDRNKSNVFVTGYDEENLLISKRLRMLGWARNSNFLSKDSLVFVFDKTNLCLDSCFRVISKSGKNDELVWADEIKSNKIIYPNRWKAELVQDSLKIPIADINKIYPFDKEPFQGLLRGNFPMPLNSPQNEDKYEKFRKFITDKLVSYWIFIVADQPKLKISAEEIYQTRMSDRFWGLNDNTSYKNQLKKGDMAVFCHGAKRFLGTAKLDTSCFETSEEQRILFSHGNDFYKTNFGVMLSDIDIWQKPKEVSAYAPQLSFVSNAKQFHVYFQGGIKKIQASDYYSITGDDFTTTTITGDADASSGVELFADEALQFPSDEQLHKAYLQIKQNILIDEETVRSIVSNLVSGKHVLLSGPIGTGKTHLATMIPKYVWGDIGGYFPEVFTASSTWTTQDVIGGIYPKIDDKEITYEIQKGCVSDTVSRN